MIPFRLVVDLSHFMFANLFKVFDIILGVNLGENNSSRPLQ